MASEATYRHQDRNIRNEFTQLIESRRVSGSDMAGGLGWALGIVLVADLLRDIGDGSSPSMFVLSFFSGQAASGGAATGIIVAQALLAAVAGLCFARSIWPSALSLPLRKSVPLAAIPQLVKAWALGEDRTAAWAAAAKAILWQFALLVFFFVLLAGSLATLSASFGSVLLALLRVLLASYSLTWVVAAVGPVARHDRPSLIGIGIGLIVAVVTMSLAGAPSQVFSAAPGPVLALADWDLWLLLALLMTVLSLQIGSLNRNENLEFDLGEGEIGVIWDLPATLNGAYLPTRIRILSHGRKILLLSRETQNAMYYQVHTSLDGQDMLAGFWRLLNLDELSRGVPTGIIKVMCHGHSRYFACEIPLKLTTLTSDSYTGQFASHDQRIAISELAFLHEGILTGGEVGDRLQGELDGAIRNEMDAAFDQALGANGNMVLSSSAISFRAAVVRFRQDADRITSLFKTRVTASLRIDQLDSLGDMHDSAVVLLEEAFAAIEAEYAKITAIDSTKSTIGAIVEDKAKEAIARMLSRGAPSQWQDTDGLRLFHLINLSVQPVKVDLTVEAQTLIAEMKQEYDAIQNYGTAKKKEMDEAVAARRNSALQQSRDVLSEPNLPLSPKSAALSAYFGSPGRGDGEVAKDAAASQLSGRSRDREGDSAGGPDSPAKMPPFPD